VAYCQLILEKDVMKTWVKFVIGLVILVYAYLLVSAITKFIKNISNLILIDYEFIIFHNRTDASISFYFIIFFIYYFPSTSHFIVTVYFFHVRWVPFHNGMAHPQVADGGDTFQFWREAANLLNKQSQAADKRWSSNLGVGRGANNSSP
jgi:hypothetical protein